MRILLTGATGFVGSALSKKLLDEGHELHVLTRNKNHLPSFMTSPKVHSFLWTDSELAPPREALEGVDGVINLMGENIAAKRWSHEQKKVLHSSRVLATQNLVLALETNLKKPLEFFISASAIGIYPANLDELLNEDSPMGNHFLAKLCQEWEAAALTIKTTKRVVIIRTSVVLEKSGGALKKMLPPFLLGLGGPIGDGNQFMSWIHLEDLINLYTKATVDPEFQGVYNATAPYPVDNFHFTKALGKAIKRPTLFPVPALPLKIILGEMSSVILDSQKIVSKRLETQGFLFKYKTIEAAFQKIFEDKR